MQKKSYNLLHPVHILQTHALIHTSLDVRLSYKLSSFFPSHIKTRCCLYLLVVVLVVGEERLDLGGAHVAAAHTAVDLVIQLLNWSHIYTRVRVNVPRFPDVFQEKRGRGSRTRRQEARSRPRAVHACTLSFSLFPSLSHSFTISRARARACALRAGNVKGTTRFKFRIRAWYEANKERIWRFFYL